MLAPWLKRSLLWPLQLGGALVCALLLGRFALLLYYPGTPETHGLFETLAPYQDRLLQATQALIAPVDGLLRALAAHLPPEGQAVFPVAEAAGVMDTLQLIPEGQRAEALYPGMAEWSALIAALVWGGLLLLLSLTASLLPDTASARGRSSGAAPVAAGRRQVASTTAPSPTTPWTTAEAERRLAGHAGHVRTPVSQPPSPPATAGPPVNQGMREMLNDLKRENITLQNRQQQMKHTMGQYFSPNVLAYMAQNRQAFENLQNQRCEVSVLFCDVRGFTAFSQSHSPEQVRAYLSEYFGLANDLILNVYQGAINKLMGDGILAYWGFPMPTADHALLATQAALGIVREVALRNQCLAAGQDPLAVGLGVCSGEVLIGNVGSSDFKDFTLIGNPVNLASRLESLNKEMNSRILISESTFQGLRGRLACRDRGVVSIRGWQGDCRVYEPMG